MDAQRKQNAAAVAHDSAAWRLVRTSRRFRAEAKLAWQYLWALAGGQPGMVVTSPVAVGMDQGAADDPARPGNRALRTLLAAGLLENLVKIREGRWQVYVVDPAEALTDAPRRRTFDPQRQLPELEDAERPADVAPLPPTLFSPSVPSVIGKYISPSPSVPSDPSVLRKPSVLRTFDVARDAEPNVKPLSVILNEAMVEGLSARAQERVEQLAGEIFRRVRDPALRKMPVYRVARAVIDGPLDRDWLADVFAWLDGGKVRHKRWMAFVGAARRAFHRHGLEWPKSQTDTR